MAVALVMTMALGIMAVSVKAGELALTDSVRSELVTVFPAKNRLSEVLDGVLYAPDTLSLESGTYAAAVICSLRDFVGPCEFIAWRVVVIEHEVVFSDWNLIATPNDSDFGSWAYQFLPAMRIQ